MKAPFCRVCFDTGKCEAMFTSHYVNDVPGKKGVVVCPTLLALECRYCKRTGHTVSRCPMITESRKIQFANKKKAAFSSAAAAAAAAAATAAATAAVAKPVIITNRFSALEMVEPVAVPPENKTYASMAALKLWEPRSPSTSPPPIVKREPRSPSTSPPQLTCIRKVVVWAECFDIDSDSDAD